MAEERCKSNNLALHRRRCLPLSSVPARKPGTEEYPGLYAGGVRCWKGVGGSFWKACRGRVSSRRCILIHDERESGRHNTRCLYNSTFPKERDMQGTTSLRGT